METTVTAAGGTLRTLLDKLGSILAQEILLLYGVREEMLFLRDELESMNVFLQKLAMIDDLDSQVRVWMKQVRELAYDAEDCIDRFTHHLGKVSGGGFVGSLHKCYLILKKLIKRHQIAVRIVNLKNIAQDVSSRRSRYNVDAHTQAAVATAVVPFDPQHHALFVEETQLRGIDRSRDLLVSWLTQNIVRKLRVVSIFGFGGLGKTTLATAAYRSPQVAKINFRYRALVTVSQKFNIKIVLETILLQVARTHPGEMEKLSTLELMEKLRNHLKKERYIIFLDDIWSVAAWDSIKFALPNDNNGSRIIVTTRIESVASTCSSQPHDRRFKIDPLERKHSRHLFFERVFGPECNCPRNLVQVSDRILEKCGGHPLSIISIANLLAARQTEGQTYQELWKKVFDSLVSELATNPSLERITKVLILSYNDLPHYLKTCFLYLSIFPEGRGIRRTVLVRKWVAEGFISNRRGLSVEEIAESYFDEFINRSMLEPENIGINGKVKTWRVHALLHDLIVSKSSEENLVYLLNDQNRRVPHDRVRRLSLNVVDLERMNKSLNLFQLRTLTIFGGTGSLVASLSLRCLRVLDLSDCTDLHTHHLNSIHKLFLLKYLNLRNTKIGKLPKQIEKLKYLETLDIRNTDVKKLPKGIVKLQNLMHLLVHNAPTMPPKIGKMRALCTLANVGLSKSLLNADGLSRLSKFGVTSRTTQTRYHQGLIRVISKLSFTLRSLTIIVERGPELLQLLSNMSSPPLFLSSLHLRGKMETLPSWISRLDNLSKAKFTYTMLPKDAIQILKTLPNLRALTLLRKSYSDSELIFKDGFRSLEFLAITSCRIRSLNFHNCSLPKLQILALTQLPLEDPMSIKHLDSLKKILICSMSTNAFKEILISIKAEARVHSKCPKVVELEEES